MVKRYLPDGRRFYGKAEVDEMPDVEKPCPDCGQGWERHGVGIGLFRLASGEMGFVLPKCPPVKRDTCDACGEHVDAFFAGNLRKRGLPIRHLLCVPCPTG